MRCGASKNQYLDHTELPLREFKGLYLDELPLLERLFNFNVFVYELKETEEGKVNAAGVFVTDTSFAIFFVSVQHTDVFP
jgi:hypothetical protein